MTAVQWPDDIEVHGGVAPTHVDLDELAAVDGALLVTARHLDAAQAALTGAVRSVADVLTAGPAARSALAALSVANDGTFGPGVLADAVRLLAARLRSAAAQYAAAEWGARHAIDRAAARTGTTAARHPLLSGLLGLVALGAATSTGLFAAGSLRVLTAVPPMIGSAGWIERNVLRQGLTVLPSVGADGRAEVAVNAVGAAVVGRFTLAPPAQGPVPVAARLLLGALPRPAGAVTVRRRPDPPTLPAPRSVADVLANVARSYAGQSVTGEAGTPPGTVTVQRLDHPDGTRAWVVEVPGTQEWRPASPVPADTTTNLRLVAGLHDDMTTAVVTAMRRAGVAPAEPVLLAGHSQGGMVVQRVAAGAAGMFDVRAVVTAGSPDTLDSTPPGVQVRHYRHRQDVVPQLDGTPDRAGAQVVVVTRDLGEGAGPVGAHDVRRYVETARKAESVLAASPSSRDFDAAVARVLGPAGTTVTTEQYVATRPVVAAPEESAAGGSAVGGEGHGTVGRRPGEGPVRRVRSP